ncbi:putative beta-ketoacyl synthase, N-domain protein [Mycobacterium xenopi 4042]|uniref:Putative beta-ketoacyl synthase, N-domain protein n=1 Tax=Mycobacterium xenopi 4042 TaxID=1299334 RepID=X7YZ75_MYCXE|nr:putative beta-ketoacyl synthase, N-domain protein [Mycobacterium xenopi 4042]
MWRRGDEVLPRCVAGRRGSITGGLRSASALLDAALHALLVAGGAEDIDGGYWCRFRGTGVLACRRASAVRPDFADGPSSVSIELADGLGCRCCRWRDGSPAGDRRTAAGRVSRSVRTGCSSWIGQRTRRFRWNPSRCTGGPIGHRRGRRAGRVCRCGIRVRISVRRRVARVYAATHAALTVLQSWLTGERAGAGGDHPRRNRVARRMSPIWRAAVWGWCGRRKPSIRPGGAGRRGLRGRRRRSGGDRGGGEPQVCLRGVWCRSRGARVPRGAACWCRPRIGPGGLALPARHVQNLTLEPIPKPTRSYSRVRSGRHTSHRRELP